MKSLQLQKLNRATYNLLLDVSPMVDQESNVLQHFLTSELVSLGTKFTFSKSHFWQNSHFQNRIFHKIHISKHKVGFAPVWSVHFSTTICSFRSWSQTSSTSHETKQRNDWGFRWYDIRTLPGIPQGMLHCLLEFETLLQFDFESVLIDGRRLRPWHCLRTR